MPQTRSIATLTINPSLDKSASVERVLADQKLRCANPAWHPGGGGVNVSRAIKRLGGESVAICAAGGPSGELFERLLGEEGIERRVAKVAGWTRENLSVYEESAGRQYRFGMPGPELAEAEWSAVLDMAASLDPAPCYLVASGSLPPGVPKDFYARLARVVRGRGARMVLDTSGEALREALAEPVFLLKMNLKELAALSGEEIQSEAHMQALALPFVREGKAELLAVTLGAAGALIVSEDLGAQRLLAPMVPSRSNVGAGDSLVAGLALGLARGMAFRDAARYGIAAGAAAAMTPGTELCRGEDAERLFREMSDYPAGA